MGIDARILIKVPTKPTEEQLKAWSWAVCDSLGADKFFINREEGQGAFSLSETYNGKEPGRFYFQDGPTLEAREGEWFLIAHVCSRFYGEGYERGDILFLSALAEWIEENIPNSEVWYGGDSSGTLAEPFSEKRRLELRKHLYSSEGRDYYSSFGQGVAPQPPRDDCKLCIPGRGPSQYGFGSHYAAYLCPGCGKRFITNDGGQTWNDKSDFHG